MIPLSILDLTPIKQGGSVAQTFRESIDLAKQAEGWGYKRYWLVEHHNTPAVASAATTVLMGHIAGETNVIRIGAGGIMLPYHAPLVVAEQFGTLCALYPGRIDLGLGRGIASNAITLQALRRTSGNLEGFAQDISELLSYFHPSQGSPVRAVPGEGTDLPIWILGASIGAAALAAELGLAFAFAAHFAPDQLEMAVAAYRARFKPSRYLSKPLLMVSLTIIVAESDDEARFLFSSTQHASDEPLPPPVADYEASLTPERAQILRSYMRYAMVGAPQTVQRKLTEFIARHKPDELIITARLYNHDARLRSFELLSRIPFS